MAAASRHAGHPLPVLSGGAGANAFVLTLWTDDPGLAARANAAGIDRVGLDLERIGKQRRQAGLGTWISSHDERDLVAVGGALASARLFARTNPVHSGTAGEVERLLALGVEVLMLPMFRGPEEVRRFTDLVAGRATVVLLLEQLDAVAELDRILAVAGVDEVHVGLNDLTISLGYGNRFTVLATGLMTEIASKVLAAGLRLGVGGIGRACDEGLPVPSDLVYAQYARLGATATLISRSFCAPPATSLSADVARARERLAEWSAASPRRLQAAADALSRHTAAMDAW